MQDKNEKLPMSYKNEKEWNATFYSHFAPLCSLNIHMFSNINKMTSLLSSYCHLSLLQNVDLAGDRYLFQEWKRVALIGVNGPNNFQGVSPWWTTRPFSRFHRYPNAFREKGYMSESNRKTRWRKKDDFLLRKKEHCTRLNRSRNRRRRPFLSYIMDARVNYNAHEGHTLYTRA